MNRNRIPDFSAATERGKANVLSEQLQFEFMQEIPAAKNPAPATTLSSSNQTREASVKRSRTKKSSEGYTHALVPDELLTEVQKVGWTCWMVQHRRKRFTTRCKAFLLHFLTAIKGKLHA